ncbi:sporulation protein YunB [Bacillus seohaeanensis]|uniref:Sporulation protein YunB n=1 Tax=Bacillus seohaeanensis TaxID=284580 RepID=A0ABW5RPI3_9BACI
MPKFKTYKPPRGRGPLPLQYVFIITFIFFTLSTAGGLWMVNRGITPTLIAYAESKSREIANLVLTNAVNKRIANVMDVNEIIYTDDAGNYQYNAEIISRVMSEIHNAAQVNLNEAEDGNIKELEFLTDVEIDQEGTKGDEGIVYTVPLGQATDNVLLANLGPQVPIRFHVVGNVSANLKDETVPWGINNAMVNIYVQLEVKVQTIIPFATKETTVKQDVLIAKGNIKGDVPEFFNNGGETSPSIEVPTN